MSLYLRLFSIFIIITYCSSVARGQDKLMGLLSKELAREFAQLKAADERLYYMSYRVDDITTYTIRTSFGAVLNIDSTRYRIFTPALRLGSYQLDNTHNSSFNQFPGSVPLSDDADIVTLALWKNTDNAYKNAVQVYEQVITNKKIKVAEEDTAADFSIAKKVSYYDKPVNYDQLRPDIEAIKQNLVAYSGLLKTESRSACRGGDTGI